MLRTAWLGLGLTLMGCPMEDNDKESGEAPEPAGNTIVDIASADPNFSTLVGLLNDDLVETLSGPGPFTVFAPTNDAFAGVDTSGLSDEQIAEILTYHVVSGSVGSSEIPAVADSVATFTLFFDTTDGVQVNDATVVDADIAASNGIIHVIDDVLLPPNILDAAGFAGLTGLAGAVAAADASVAETLGGEGDFTVFAPTNDAFADIAADIPTDPGEIADILFYHALTSSVDSGSIPARADSASGITMFFDTTDGVAVNGATVQIADIRTTNGIVHVIDAVLLPPDIVGAAGLAGLTELATAVGAADASVLAALTSAGPFTVFAPTNDAFGSFTLPADQTLENVLFYHAYPGSFDSANLPAKADSALSSWVRAPPLLSALITTDGGAAINGASVVIADVRTTNGIVHVIDTVLTPPSILDLAGIAGLTELATAVTNQSLVPTLSGPGPFTVFAPTNMAFMGAPPVSGQTLTDVLLYHVVDLTVPSPVLEGDLTDGEVPTALGGDDTITVDTGAGTVEGAGLVLTDVNGTNGTVHVIDAVMIPPSIAN